MRAPSDSDIIIGIEGVGEFRYARRTLGDNLRIRAEFLRNLNGVAPGADEELDAFAHIFATHKTLCVACPDGWADFAAMRLDGNTGAVDTILDLSLKLRETEDSFRGGAEKAS